MTLLDPSFEDLISDAEAPFVGWDFSWITATRRMVEAPLDWSYASKILPYLKMADSLLDMGTGGGELLAKLRPLPKHTCATEGYAPNVSLARQRLLPMGIQVWEVGGDGVLPFDDNSFDLVINRHAAYNESEVHRILKPGGHFLTQQVGGQNERELNKLLGADDNSSFAGWNLDDAVHRLRCHRFDILEEQEAFPVSRYYDVGAIVYYLKAVPWQVPDFSLKKYRDGLYRIHCMIQRDGYLDIPMHRFFIAARKPVS